MEKDLPLNKKRLKEFFTAPVEIAGNFVAYRHLLSQMVIREIKGRFAGSFGGFLWNFVHPVLMLVIYLVVFVYIFNMRIGSDAGHGTSAIYIMAGLFPWIIISEGLSRGTSSLIENATLIQKTPFPVEILPAKAVLAPFFGQGLVVLLLALYTAVFTGFNESILLLPLIVVLQSLFTLGMAFLAATISVFFRDVIQIEQILISFWIYLTPILYPISMLPEWARTAMYFNPIYPFISIYQSMFIKGALLRTDMIFFAFIWSLSSFLTGAFVFNKMKYEFADWL